MCPVVTQWSTAQLDDIKCFLSSKTCCIFASDIKSVVSMMGRFSAFISILSLEVKSVVIRRIIIKMVCFSFTILSVLC